MGAAAKLKKEAEEKVVHAKNELADKTREEAAKVVSEANQKEAAAKAMLVKIDNAQCSKHPGCAKLSGYCCPTLNTNKMHLGSQKLDGETLGCCGTSQNLATETQAPTTGNFGAASILFAAFSGSALTAMVLKFFPGKDSTNAPYERLIA